tara:strand:+ start:3932 stop:4462 length:531 start_codon:yes stop_codon:yes gene_type:complete
MQLNILIEKFQQKNEEAFEELYNRYSKSMHGVIYNIVRDHGIADEIMQEVFIEAWNNSSSYSVEKERFFTWLLKISRNAAMEKRASKNLNDEDNTQKVDFFADIIQNNISVDSQTEDLGIELFVSKLANSCIEVIELLYFKGYSQQKASESLDMPMGTIKTRNRNCLKELRLMLNI